MSMLFRNAARQRQFDVADATPMNAFEVGDK